jgi:arylamine N-acetyltransferase
MNEKHRMKQTASVFFDHFGISPDKPDMDSLRIIVSQFSRIPWENLTKFLVKAQQLPLENRLRLADTVISEHIENGAGGTCFSLTEALGTILSFAGYHCHPVMADMKHGKNIHCALSVITVDGSRFLADPGYLVPIPVPLEPGEFPEVEAYGDRLIWEPIDNGRMYDLYTVNDSGKNWKYRIRMNPVSPDEFTSHWQRSFDATGMNSLHLNCRNENGRLSAHNLNLRRVNADGKKNEKLRDDYSEKIEAYFGLSRDIAQTAEREWKKSCLDR